MSVAARRLKLVVKFSRAFPHDREGMLFETFFIGSAAELGIDG